jgi:hypothetical protein
VARFSSPQEMLSANVVRAAANRAWPSCGVECLRSEEAFERYTGIFEH